MPPSPDTLRRPLYAVAAAVALLALAVAFRGGTPELLPAAHAQPAAVAGGGGLYLMPGQLAANKWGLYLMDTDAGTLGVYWWDAGNDQLELKAVRDFTNDRQLRDYNTFPPPREVAEILAQERADDRVDGPAD